MGSNAIYSDLIKKEKFGHKDTRSENVIRRRRPETASKAAEGERLAQDRFSFTAVRRHQHGQHLDLDLSASRNEEQKISVVLSSLLLMVLVRAALED